MNFNKYLEGKLVDPEEKIPGSKAKDFTRNIKRCPKCKYKGPGWEVIAGKKTVDHRGTAHEWKGKCPKCGEVSFGSDIIVATYESNARNTY